MRTYPPSVNGSISPDVTEATAANDNSGNGSSTTVPHPALTPQIVWGALRPPPTSDGTSGTIPPVPEGLIKFIKALFRPEDLIRTRPIESWIEAGKKRSRIIYRQMRLLSLSELLTPETWNRILSDAAAEHANVFFGVCPRPADGCDRASHIRSVSVLWADLDNCTVEDALHRCAAAGLPRPSIVVRSGHGVHLYWLLVEPYFIDDAGQPRPVLKDWVDVTTCEGTPKRKARYYVVDESTGERIYEFVRDPNTGGDSRKKNPEFPSTLSQKAQHIEQMIEGMNKVIGGDHTHNLDRLLRLPCTWNRKDERNGKAPVQCELVECDSSRRCAFAEFAKFAAMSPAKAESENISKIKLPKRPLTPGRRNKLIHFINACAATPSGERSEADFALCCFAVRTGLDPEEVWAEVQDISKFAEAGREYFDRTWQNAETRIRADMYDRERRKAGADSSCAGPATANTSHSEGGTESSQAEQNPEASGWPDESQDGAAGSDDGGSGAVKEAADDPHRLARAWLSQHAAHPDGKRVRYFRGAFWEWLRTHWREIPTKDFEARLTRYCRRYMEKEHKELVARWRGEGPPPNIPKVTGQLVSNVMQAIGGEVLVPSDTLQPSWLDGASPEQRNYIALTNGLLDMDALVEGRLEPLLPHSPLWFSPNCLPFPFDLEATCPRWHRFLQRNLAGDPEKIALLQEWFGYLLLANTSYQRFLLMVGEGRNGKSVVCAVIEALLGLDNISSVPLELFGDKFRLAATLGKLVNLIAEIGELDKMAEGQLKSFVVGDPMGFEEKYKPAFVARPTARIVAATNNVPRFSDKSDGIWRRICLLNFNVQIPEEETIPGMDKPAYWREELPGIFAWALIGYLNLHNKGHFTIPAESREAVETLRQDASAARRFLLEEFEPSTDPGSSLLSEAFYRWYCEWCVAHGHKPLADCQFGREGVHSQKVAPFWD